MQAAAGAFGLMGTQGAGAWTDMQQAAAAAASFYQRQAGLTGSTGTVAFDPSSSSSKIRGLPYRTSVRYLQKYKRNRLMLNLLGNSGKVFNVQVISKSLEDT